MNDIGARWTEEKCASATGTWGSFEKVANGELRKKDSSNSHSLRKFRRSPLKRHEPTGSEKQH